MTGAAFKSEFPQKKPKMDSYLNYKHFNRNHFEEEIENTIITQIPSPKSSLKTLKTLKTWLLKL